MDETILSQNKHGQNITTVNAFYSAEERSTDPWLKETADAAHCDHTLWTHCYKNDK